MPPSSVLMSRNVVLLQIKTFTSQLCYQWQFNVAMCNVCKVPMENWLLKNLMKSSTFYNKTVYFNFILTILNMNKNYRFCKKNCHKSDKIYYLLNAFRLKKNVESHFLLLSFFDNINFSRILLIIKLYPIFDD